MDYIVENSGRQIKIGLDLTVGYLGYTRMTEVLKRYLSTIVLLPLKPLIQLRIMI